MSGNFLKNTVFMMAFMLFAAFLAAGPKVISVTMNPSTPTFGDAVDITVRYCSQNYNAAMIDIAISSQPTKTSAELSGNGQVFVVSRAGIDVATSQPQATTGGEIGWLANANPNGPGTGNCTDCNNNVQSTIRTVTYTVHVPPASYYPGCNVTKLYLYVGMKDQNLNAPEWIGSSVCALDPPALSWNIGTIPRGFSISKRTVGAVQIIGDLVLFSIDYEYWNGPFSITDIVPPNGGALQLVSFGPTSIAGVPATGPAVGASTGNFSWTMYDRTGMAGTASGTVWMLYRQATAPVFNTKYKNSATGTMPLVGSVPADATNTVGQAAVSIIKDQSESNPSYDDNITYILTYNVNGMELVGYQPFDDIPNGIYGKYGIGGPAVPGWSFVPQNGTEGQWEVADNCNTGDRVITGSVSATKQYPALLFNGLPATSKMCSGIIETDVLIDPNGYEGSDAMIFIRNDGLASGNAYGLAISVDKNIGGYTAGHIEFQACTAGPGCYWPPAVAIPGQPDPTITANKWWRVKIWIDPANQYHFMAKAWPKGDPEPSGYQIEWNDTDAARRTALNCNNGSNWRPGIAEQGGDDATKYAKDSYNNFVVYNPFTAATTTVWDTLPNNNDGSVVYTGMNTPAAPKSGSFAGGVVTFNLGNLQDEGGSLTWWGKVKSCNPITNESWIGGTGIIAQKSNRVIASPICAEITGLTKTALPLTPVLNGDNITWIITYCNDSVGVLHNYVITDPVPAGVQCTSCTGGCTGCPGTGTVSWSLGDIPKGTCNQSVTWVGKVTAVP